MMAKKAYYRGDRETRAVLDENKRVLLSDSKIAAIVHEFGHGQVVRETAELRKDLNNALKPLKDNGAIGQVKYLKENFLKQLDKIKDTPKQRWVLSAVGRNYAGLIKDEGVKSEDMTAYDKLIGRTGYSNYERYVEAKIEEFFALRKMFSGWISDPAIELRMLAFLAPVELDSFVCVVLPRIFSKYFPHKGTTSSPQSACNKFIQSVLRAAEITDADADLMQSIVKRRQRGKKNGLVP